MDTSKALQAEWPIRSLECLGGWDTTITISALAPMMTKSCPQPSCLMMVNRNVDIPHRGTIMTQEKITQVNLTAMTCIVTDLTVELTQWCFDLVTRPICLRNRSGKVITKWLRAPFRTVMQVRVDLSVNPSRMLTSKIEAKVLGLLKSWRTRQERRQATGRVSHQVRLRNTPILSV